MTPTEFTWYLAGLNDSLAYGQPPNALQWATVQVALGQLFQKETPNRFPIPVTGDYRPRWTWNDGVPISNGIAPIC